MFPLLLGFSAFVLRENQEKKEEEKWLKVQFKPQRARMCTLCSCDLVSMYSNPCPFPLSSISLHVSSRELFVRHNAKKRRVAVIKNPQKKEKKNKNEGSICFACESTLAGISNQRKTTLTRAVEKTEN